MGELINFLSGTSRAMLPVSNIGGILVNTPEVLKSASGFTKEMEEIERAGPLYVMADSGGYQGFVAREHNRTITTKKDYILFTMNDNAPIYGKNIFNLTPRHTFDAAYLLHPDFIVSPDIPVPIPEHHDQRLFLFLESLAYNVYCAHELSRLLQEARLETKLFVPVQAYDMGQFSYFMDALQGLAFYGLSIPRRNMTIPKLLLFLLKTASYGVPAVHVLGTGRFSFIVILAYSARNWFSYVSFDSTNIMRFSTVNQYLQPYTILPLDLRIDQDVDLSMPIRCDCGWCSYWRSFHEIKHEAGEEKRAFMMNHNHFVVEQLMKETYDHSASALSLARFLDEKAQERRVQIQEIYRLLSLVESLGKSAFRADVIESLFRKFCT